MTTDRTVPCETELREALAALAHEQWSGWMRYLFSRAIESMTGGAFLPGEWVTRWDRQMNTPYAQLSEDEKDSDRKEADRVLALVGDLAARVRAEQAEAIARLATVTKEHAVKFAELESRCNTQLATQAQEIARLTAEVELLKVSISNLDRQLEMSYVIRRETEAALASALTPEQIRERLEPLIEKWRSDANEKYRSGDMRDDPYDDLAMELRFRSSQQRADADLLDAALSTLLSPLEPSHE